MLNWFLLTLLHPFTTICIPHKQFMLPYNDHHMSRTQDILPGILGSAQFEFEIWGKPNLTFSSWLILTFSSWLILGRRYQVSEANSFDSLAYLSVFYTYHNLDCRQMSWSNPNALFLLETSLETSSISRWSMPSTCFSICFLKVASQEALMAKKALVRMYA